MRVRVFAVLLVAICVMSLAVIAQAAGVSLGVESKGTYICWFTYPGTGGTQQVTEPVRVQGDKANLSIVDIPGSDLKPVTLCVMDRKTGNVAVIPLKGKDSIQVKDSNFEYVGNVALRVVAEDGSPVESAIIKVTDGVGDEHVVALTPADEGMIHLRNVAAGQINVKVQTDGLKKTIDSDVELPLERDTPAFQTDIRVSGDVNTVSATTEPSESSEKPGKHSEKSESGKKKESSGGGSLLSSLVGVILLALIIATVWTILKSKGITAKDTLQKLGVQVNEDGQEPAIPGQPQSPIPAVDSNKCPFCGQDKDAAGNCACSLTGAPAASVSSASAVFAPRLIGSQGVYAMRIFELKVTNIVGREPSCDVALPEDTTVSRRHAVITVSGSECSIKDEGSSNGTYINGAKVTEQTLKPGDELRIGDSKFRYEA